MSTAVAVLSPGLVRTTGPAAKDIKVDRDRTTSLQVRVDAACAERFSALAAAMGISQSELLRRAVDGILADAEGQIGAPEHRAQRNE